MFLQFLAYLSQLKIPTRVHSVWKAPRRICHKVSFGGYHPLMFRALPARSTLSSSESLYQTSHQFKIDSWKEEKPKEESKAKDQ
jgi:hypothetical protein